jgi:Fe-S cluster assembly iron-binding protein IscA
MLSVTENAAAHLAEMLNEAPDEAAVRFVPQGNGLLPQLDSERPGDTKFTHDEKTVLVLDQQISELLADKTLDVKDMGQGPQLALT